MKRLHSSNVLRYAASGGNQSTVRRHYMRWRREQNPPLPVRCDNRDCHFHTHPLIWNGEPLKPILDHENGNKADNRPFNLRLLCPNCDSQLSTRGGGNKGRVENWLDGFAVTAESYRGYWLFPTNSFSAANIPPGCTEAELSNLNQHERIKKFDLRDFSFDNEVVVAGGWIYVDLPIAEETRPKSTAINKLLRWLS